MERLQGWADLKAGEGWIRESHQVDDEGHPADEEQSECQHREDAKKPVSARNLELLLQLVQVLFGRELVMVKKGIKVGGGGGGG